MSSDEAITYVLANRSSLMGPYMLTWFIDGSYSMPHVPAMCTVPN